MIKVLTVKRLLVFLSLSIFLALAFVPLVSADYTVLVNFEIDSYPYTFVEGSLSGSGGNPGAHADDLYFNLSGDSYHVRRSQVRVNTCANVVQAGFDVNHDRGGSGAVALFIFVYDADDNLLATLDWTGEYGILQGTWQTFFAGLAGATTNAAYLIASAGMSGNAGDTGVENGNAWIDNIVVVCDGDLPPEPIYKPLAEADIDAEWGIFDAESFQPDYPALVDVVSNLYEIAFEEAFDLEVDFLESIELFPERNLVVATSNDEGDFVYAVADGLVVDIEPVGQYNCFHLEFVLGNCLLMLDRSTSDEEYINRFFYLVQSANLWKVTVAFEDGFLEYYVEDAPLYVTEGRSITAGCIIGKTTPFEQVNSPIIEQMYLEIGGEIDFVLGEIDLNVGLTFVSAQTFDRAGAFIAYIIPEDDDEPVEIVSRMTIPVIIGNACNSDPDFASCLGDPELNDPTAWQEIGIVQWLSPSGARLSPNASITYGGMPLIETDEYSMRVMVRRVQPSGGAVTLRIGTTTSISFQLTLEREAFEIPAAEHEPDSPPLYSWAVTNSGPTPIEVESVCVSSGSPGQSPTTCYFNNFSFDQGTSGWDLSGAVSPGNLGGEIYMPHESSIAQDVQLYPDGVEAHDYELYVKAAVTGGAQANTLTTASFEYRIGGGSWTPLLDPASGTSGYPFSNFYLFPNNEILFTILVPIGSVTDDSLEIRYIEDREPDTPGVVFVREVCINDPFNHHPDPGGGNTPPFTPTCSTITVPSESDIGLWIFYLWQNLDHFFQCDLMVILNQIFTMTYQVYRYAQWSGLYGQAVMNMTIRWVTKDVVGWLGGHLSNIAVGQVTVIQGQPQQCSDLFCLLTNIFDGLFNQLISPLLDIVEQITDILSSIVNAAISLLGTIINSVVSLLVLFASQVLSLFILARDLLAALITAFNSAEPIMIPGVPNCADPQSSGWCMSLWVMENTVFSPDSPGAAIIPIFTALMSIHLILWCIGRFKQTMIQMGSTT